MKYKIDQNQSDMDIQIFDIKTDKEKVLEALQECQEGRCSCPTDEYEKLESLSIEETEEGVELHLKSKQGNQLNKEEVERCLDYTKEQINKS